MYKWQAATQFESSPIRILENAAYQEIIKMGWEVVPLILDDMKLNGGLWFEALVKITGECPIPVEHAGNIDAMRGDWLKWGIDRCMVAQTNG